ncbi:MAG: BatA domain-containing protein [bacterium]
MSFLQSFFLYGLFAVSLPFIIHLLNRRKAKRVPFSTLYFLRELQKKKMRRLKLRQIILLLLRALVIGMLVLAFARPTMHSNLALLGKTNVRTAAAIVLDNSMSMRWEGNRGVRYNQALKSAEKILRQLKAGDQISLFVPCVLGELSAFQTFETIDGLLNLLNNSQPSIQYGDMVQTVNQAYSHLQKSILPNKEMYIISDFQRSSWQPDKLNEISSKESNIRSFLIDLSDATNENAGLAKVELRQQIVELNKPITVAAQVENFGEQDFDELMVHAYLDGTRVGQKTLNLEEGRREETSFNLTLKKSGFISGMIELDDDPLLEDNRGYFTFYLHDRISLLLLGDANDLEYIKLALAPNPERNQLFEFTSRVRLQNLVRPLAYFPLVIVADPLLLSESDVAKLVQYVNGGGHMIFFPGANTDLRTTNERFSKPLGIPIFRESRGSIGNTGSYITWGDVDFRHPIFSTVFQRKAEDLDSPQHYFRLVLDAESSGVDVIKYSDNSSFLHITQVQNGTVILFTSALDTRWSNFVYKSIFPPLIYRCVIYLASQNQQRASTAIVGEEIRSDVFDPEASYTIIRPDGVMEKVTPEQSGVTMQIRYANAKVPGIYNLTQSDAILKQWAVNADPRESGWEKVPLDEVKTLLGGQVTELSLSDEFAEEINRNRFGSEITKWFFLAALAFMIMEMLLSREDLLAGVPRLKKILKEDT